MEEHLWRSIYGGAWSRAPVLPCTRAPVLRCSRAPVLPTRLQTHKEKLNKHTDPSCKSLMIRACSLVLSDHVHDVLHDYYNKRPTTTTTDIT